MKVKNTERPGYLPVLTPGERAGRPASERMVISSPMSFAGSAQRLWKMTEGHDKDWQTAAMAALAVSCITMAWSVIVCWYAIFWIWLVPFRLLRRGDRKAKVRAAQHRELLEAAREQR